MSDAQAGKTLMIVYVGKKPVKRDTVAGTGTVWAGYGDVQEVPHGAGVKMLQHPDVWVKDREFEKMARPNESKGIPVTASGEIIDKPEEDGQDEGVEAETETQEGSTETTPKNLGVTEAIQALDKENPEHFSQSTGNPKIAAVRKLAGDDVTTQQVAEAWKAIQGA